MLTVRLVNFGTVLADRFETIGEAIAKARATGFECAIDDPERGCVAQWSPLNGTYIRTTAEEQQWRS